jgi:hypothetical protein
MKVVHRKTTANRGGVTCVDHKLKSSNRSVCAGFVEVIPVALDDGNDTSLDSRWALFPNFDSFVKLRLVFIIPVFNIVPWGKFLSKFGPCQDGPVFFKD